MNAVNINFRRRIVINMSGVLTALRKVLSYQMTIAEWIGLAILLGVPYVVVGAIWSSTHTDHLSGLHGADLVVPYLGSIVSLPVRSVSRPRCGPSC